MLAFCPAERLVSVRRSATVGPDAARQTALSGCEQKELKEIESDWKENLVVSDMGCLHKWHMVESSQLPLRLGGLLRHCRLPEGTRPGEDSQGK